MRLFELINAICKVYDNKNFRPHDGITYCNQAVNSVAMELGYLGFNNLNANKIIGVMEKSDKWTKIDMEEAQETANRGHLVIAGLKEEPHGHVVVIRPGIVSFSNKWQKECPQCMNIGNNVSIRQGVNWAFITIPKFYVFEHSEHEYEQERKKCFS